MLVDLSCPTPYLVAAALLFFLYDRHHRRLPWFVFVFLPITLYYSHVFCQRGEPERAWTLVAVYAAVIAASHLFNTSIVVAY